MTLDLSRLPALVWLDAIKAQQNVIEVAYIDTKGNYFNSNGRYMCTDTTVLNTAYRIIYYGTLKDLLPEEFI